MRFHYTDAPGLCPRDKCAVCETQRLVELCLDAGATPGEILGLTALVMSKVTGVEIKIQEQEYPTQDESVH